MFTQQTVQWWQWMSYSCKHPRTKFIDSDECAQAEPDLVTPGVHMREVADSLKFFSMPKSLFVFKVCCHVFALTLLTSVAFHDLFSATVFAFVLFVGNFTTEGSRTWGWKAVHYFQAQEAVMCLIEKIKMLITLFSGVSRTVRSLQSMLKCLTQRT